MGTVQLRTFATSVAIGLLITVALGPGLGTVAGHDDIAADICKLESAATISGPDEDPSDTSTGNVTVKWTRGDLAIDAFIVTHGITLTNEKTERHGHTENYKIDWSGAVNTSLDLNPLTATPPPEDGDPPSEFQWVLTGFAFDEEVITVVTPFCGGLDGIKGHRTAPMSADAA